MAYYPNVEYPVYADIVGGSAVSGATIDARVYIPDYSIALGELHGTKADMEAVANVDERISELECAVYSMMDVLDGLKKCIDDAESGLLDSEKFYNEVKMLINI